MLSHLAEAISRSFWNNAPDIIRAASQSPLGILALIVLGLSALAVIFFRKAPVGIQLIIFLLLLASGLAYGYAITRESDQRPSNEKIVEEAKPVEVESPFRPSEWLVFIGQYSSQAEVRRKRDAASRLGFPNSEIFQQGGYFHLRFRFATREAAEDAAAKLKQAHISHEPDVIHRPNDE